MSRITVFYLVLAVYFIISYFVVSRFYRIKHSEYLPEDIIRYIIRISATFTLTLTILLLSLKKLYDFFKFQNFNSIRIIVLGVLLLSVTMLVIAITNLNIVKKIRNKQK